MANKTLAFEIGTEELPAFDLHNATVKLPALAAAALDGEKIPHGEISVYSTPRRMIVIAADVPEQTEAAVEEFRGPSAKIAFDADGNPTKAALGFARGKGVDPSALELRDEGGVQYVYAVRETASEDVAAKLPALLKGLIESVPWPKTQRWGARREQFSRPVRWLFAMLGEEVVPVEWAGLMASAETRGHRFLSPGPHKVASADELIAVLEANYVVPSEAAREQCIREQVAAIEERTGLVADLPARTMEEVVNLAEYPTVMVGSFDELFLDVPKEITVDAMLVHQRYFPLFNADGSLANKFLITSNGNPEFEANIVDGNERVVAARLYDAKFFYDEDLKLPLEAYVDRLGEVVFQEQLGTTRAKTDRLVKLAGHLASEAGLGAEGIADSKRAAYLCKADLVTGAVVEFTSVQGIMGSYYAEAAGEKPEVARAIGDHYRPRFAGDAVPASDVGKAVAFADKLDTICGMFAIGQGPTGTSDPFALRRSAIGILAIMESGFGVWLSDAIDAALNAYAEQGLSFDADEAHKAVVDFFIGRTKVMLRDAGCEASTIEAVLASGVEDPLTLIARCHALEDARENQRETFEDLATAYARANNLRDSEAGTDVDHALFGEVEQLLDNAITIASDKVGEALETDSYAEALEQLAALRGPIDSFFEGVMVMDENPELRANRLKLLNRFVAVFANVADFAKL